MASSRLQWRRFTFFDKELCDDNVEQTLGARVTCAVAEGGSLIFGDILGNVYISDRSTQLSDKKHKLFRGEVKGLAFIYHPQHRQRQYIIAIGDDTEGSVLTAAGTRLRADNSVIKVGQRLLPFLTWLILCTYPTCLPFIEVNEHEYETSHCSIEQKQNRVE